MNTELKIEGMSCGHCVKAVQQALEEVPGVTKAEVSLETNSAQVHHAENVEVKTLIEAVEDEGYSATGA
jgi:copper chaperone